MTVTTYKWSLERYHRAIEAGIFDGQPIELLRGDLIVMPPEREPHAYYNTETADYLRALLGERVKIRDAKPITLPNDSEPAPDIAVVKPLGEIYLQHHPYPEDIFWVIEFSQATLSKDLNEKKEIYGEAGIIEYWVVNLKTPQLQVFRDLNNGEYKTELTFTTGTISPLAFPDVSVQVQRLIGLPK
ncbi:MULTISPECIES: Uma2 family endonuclease [Calothrix]|uniref:Uma2 family endonuclease n=2 Tax=Calothrix TaxID=1186 RepID=A0ABR8AGQ1_9CYAN|nr:MULTISPECIES: Uma2 family endonuclease [Calothrix]MBD2198690.1 Uma2 family endonuclease [Calothrix parietina FACHB-288]MBD2228699.1 Uma2 family endonuclease [Calothrix anomala FACHB-343]